MSQEVKGREKTNYKDKGSQEEQENSPQCSVSAPTKLGSIEIRLSLLLDPQHQISYSRLYTEWRWQKGVLSILRKQLNPAKYRVCHNYIYTDRLCGLMVRVLGYRSGGPGSIPGTTRKKVVGLERGSLSLVSTTEELLDRKVAAPV
jgi:hypothetical protein